jgi:hypothetical protein
LISSATPRNGAAAVAGQMHGMVERAQVDNIGFSSLLRGTDEIACAMFLDAGYPFQDATSRAIRRRTGNPEILQWCLQV